MGDEKVGVAGALAKRRDADRRYADAVVKVLTETAGCDFVAQVAVGHGDQADIDMARFAVADAVDDAFLQHAKKVGLEVEREFTDFVQAQGAAIGEFEAAKATFGGGPGEGAPDVAEQFAGNQFL